MAASKTFYLETFGCQMNVHDSEKVIGTLRHEGYAQVDSEAAADLILYNTCSIRDKAEQKVFNRLNDYKKLHASGKRFVVLGCVAQQEGERIFERAPYVSMVSGSASYRKLPEMLDRLEAGEQRITGLDDRQTEETFETEFTARTNPHRGYITIIEGCDKFCAYCVVPYTRGKERSRTSTSVLAEAQKLAEAGYTEIQLLGQNVNSYKDREGKCSFAELLAAVGQVPGIRAGLVRPRPSPGAERIDARVGSDAAGIQPHGIPAAHSLDPIRTPADQHHHRHDRRFSGRDRRGF
jgi:tRNA-2-methylthio-N6-dimethylallyladenosine synthase